MDFKKNNEGTSKDTEANLNEFSIANMQQFGQ